jgi:hypothetical protein
MTFAARCRGLFEFAAISLRQLEEESLGFVLSEQFCELLSRVSHVASDPTSALYSEYGRILQHAYPEGNSTHAKELFSRYRQVVGALVLLRQPLGTQALADLLGVSSQHVRAVLRPLSSVIAVPSSDDDEHPISFYHASFPEFLLPVSTDQEDSTRLRYHIHAAEHEAILADRCLDIMNSTLVYNICRISNLFTYNEKIPGITDKLNIHVPGHLRYAALRWAEHLEPSGHSARVQMHLHDWCEGKMMFYLELMSLLGQCDVILPLLAHAIVWAQVRTLFLPLY